MKQILLFMIYLEFNYLAQSRMSISFFFLIKINVKKIYIYFLTQHFQFPYFSKFVVLSLLSFAELLLYFQ